MDCRPVEVRALSRRSLLLGAAACALAAPASEADLYFQQSIGRLHRWPRPHAVVTYMRRVDDIDRLILETIEHKQERYQWRS